MKLTVQHEDGTVEVISTTDEHPFHVVHTGEWTRADALVIGDLLSTMTGAAELLAVEYGSEQVPVYNLSIPGSPTYYVGSHGVWVHNCEIFKTFKIGGSAAHGSIAGGLAKLEIGFIQNGGDLRRLAREMKSWSKNNGATSAMLETGPIDPVNARSVIESLSRHADTGSPYFGGQVVRTGSDNFSIHWMTLP